MAKIIIDQKQRDALATIERNLEEISAVDKMLNRGKNTGLCVAVRSGKKLGKEISLTGRHATRVDTILAQHRASLVKDVQNLAAKYMIELTDEDEAILNNAQEASAAPSAVEEEAPEVDIPSEEEAELDEYDEDDDEEYDDI